MAAYAGRLHDIQQTLDPTTGTSAEREVRFIALSAELSANRDPVVQHMGKTMRSFFPGLFVGGDDLDLPFDNLDLERAFRLPKGHERRIHGHAHAGIRIVRRGATLLLVLDAHQRHPKPFQAEALLPWLLPWLHAREPASQRACRRRGGIMRKARSKKKRPQLLAELERRCKLVIPDS